MNNNEMFPTLFNSETVIEEQDTEAFRYDVLDPEDREFVQEKEYEVRAGWKRAALEIMEVGQNLLLVQERLRLANKGKHGSFVGWLKKAGLSTYNAYFSMKAFTRFGNDKNFALQNFSPEVVRELTYASDQVVGQVISGETKPNRIAIREEEKKRKEAERERNQALIAEAKAKADAQAAQQQLFLFQQTSQAEIDALSQQMEELKQEMQAITTPEIEIREIKTEVLPLSVKNDLEKYQKQIDELTGNLEFEKKTIPPETQKQMEALQKHLDKLKEDRKQLEETNKTQQERLKNLDTQLSVAIQNRITSLNDERIRQEWRTINSEARSCMMRLLGQWPTALDVKSFESDDWERLSQLKATLKRVLEECDNLNYNGDDMIVNERTVEEPLAYIESPLSYTSYTSYTGDSHA